MKDLLGGPQYTQNLILPLEILSSMEELNVRKKAVEVLIIISHNQD
jgi:hypothetical protein